jgi:anaerobic magnesium-protoporphyrin IX monomethyl ester cyclase
VFYGLDIGIVKHPRVILVFPPIDTPAPSLPPVGLLKLAAILEKAKYPTSVVDCILLLRQGFLSRNKHIYEQIARLVNDNEPEFVGFTTQCASYPSCINIAKNIKSERPDTKIIFGGPYSSLCAAESMKNFSEIDYVVIGEGETTFIELLRTIEAREEIQNVKGVVFRDGDKIISNPKRAEIQELDSLPFPAYHLLSLRGSTSNPLEEYRAVNASIFGYNFPIKTLIDDGRGCSSRCGYCSEPIMWGRRSRRRSTKNILEEILWLKSSFGVQVIEFAHDHFTSQKAKVKGLCRGLLDYHVDLRWVCRARLNKVDQPLLKEMKKAGCAEIIYGVESFSADTLESMQKDLCHPEWLPEAIQQSTDNDIISHLSFIIGLPSEKPEQLEQTLQKITSLVISTNGLSIPYIHLLSLLPGTGMWRDYRDQLELKRIPDFSEGVDFDNGKIMEEDWHLIEDHPLIFSSFYNVKPRHIPIDVLYVIHKCFVPFVQSQCIEITKLSSVLDGQWLQFFGGLQQWLGEELGDVDGLRRLGRSEFIDLIRRYDRNFSFQQFMKALSPQGKS